jgi:2-(1,2-epoxy-1,2-dihydrophenyl)acetyl-CoA isomerase
VARFEKPILCAVNGAAAGGGMDLALACDIRVAGQSAKFAETYAKIGLAPGGGGAYFLPKLIGKAQALEMLWTAEFIGADTAKELGLVNHVYPDSELMAETMKLAQKIASQPPLSVKLIKRLVEQGMRADMETAFDLVSSHIAILRSGHDHKEAIAAFKEKRPGKYEGY